MRLVPIMLMFVAMTAQAEFPQMFTLEPAQGRAGEVVNLRVVAVDGCFRTGGISSLVLNGSAVTATMITTDESPPNGCLPEWVTPRLMSMGTFEPGNYQVEVVVCTNAPIPCQTQANLSLAVFGSTGQRFTVPTLSGAVVILLVFAVMAMGAANPRRP